MYFCVLIFYQNMMNTVALEAQKASLAREILSIDDEMMVHNIWLFIKEYKPDVCQQDLSEKRQLGILDGKARIVFKDDFEMTTEELLELK